MPHKNKKTVHYWKADFYIACLVMIFVIAGSSMLISSHSTQIMGRSTARVETEEKVIALTFDDGPLDKHIDEILNTLETNNVKATFFLIGKEIYAHPYAAKKLAESGHEIGNHGYTHRSLMFIPYQTIAREVELTDRAIRATGYEGPIHFRPPYGHKYLVLPYYLSRHDRETIFWSMAPDDLYKKAEDMTRYVLDEVKPGSIIIMHSMEDHRSEQRKALHQFIPELQRRGYKFVTVSELLNYR